MEDNIFDPTEWASQEGSSGYRSPFAAGDNRARIEEGIKALEAQGRDITEGYARWRDIGFALASEFDEAIGREFFHRISRMNPAYDFKECDLQFTHCFKAKGAGISIASLFYFLREAGIEIKTFQRPASADPLQEAEKILEDENFDDITEEITRTDVTVLPDDVFENLPDFLKKVVQTAEGSEERDILLVGALTVLSGCLGNFYGYYRKKLVYPNFYFFLTAKASAGKGSLYNCRHLVSPIHWQLREDTKIQRKLYDQDLTAYNSSKEKETEKPVEPKEQMLFIPANSSNTGFFQLIHDNNSKGLIFETEADTLALIFRADYGNYSDGFRKAFHHEAISYYRRTDKEFVEIEYPQISTVLSGTPNQVKSLIKSSENGLFSRFLYYYMDFKPVWEDTFSEEEDQVEEIFNQLGSRFFNYYQDLKEAGQIRVILTPEQRSRFFDHFTNTQTKYLAVFGDDFAATIRRVGLIAYRIMMVLTALRLMEFPEAREKTVSVGDADYNTAVRMVTVMLKHGAYIYSKLPGEKEVAARNLPEYALLNLLEERFTTQEVLDAAGKLKMNRRKVFRMLRRFLKAGVITKRSRGKYLKA